MHKQKGAALIVVLALLVGAVVIGISSMQSSLVDERLAGNYRMASQAQMNAEKAASAAIADNEKPDGFFIPATWEEKEYTGAAEGALTTLLTKSDINAASWEKDLREIGYRTLHDSAVVTDNFNDTACDPGADASGAARRDKCFYFPMTIPDKDGADKPADYVVAVGAVLDDADNPHNPQASRIVLLEIKSSATNVHDGINPDIAAMFETYLMASKDNTRVDPAEKGGTGGPNLTLDGPLHMMDDDQDFKKSGNGVIKGENYEETRGDNGLPEGLNGKLPKFNLKEFEQTAKKDAEGNERPVTKKSGKSACRNLPQDLGGKTYICEDQQELKDVSFKNGTIVFKTQADFKGPTTLENVNIVAKGQITFTGDFASTNSKVGAKSEVEYNDDGERGTSRVTNSHFMTESNVQMNFGNDFVVDGGFFYANDESEIEFGDSSDAEPCGSAIGVGQSELYVGTIKRFKHCPDGTGESDPSVKSWR
ncbi:MAG: pilus assembly PilX N-terminal domain-containing protein [Halomonas subglaciescola]|nr:pilus assembly PilX N-terminal domain-containing protein [Halomonas subglaciescola]